MSTTLTSTSNAKIVYDHSVDVPAPKAEIVAKMHEMGFLQNTVRHSETPQLIFSVENGGQTSIYSIQTLSHNPPRVRVRHVIVKGTGIFDQQMHGMNVEKMIKQLPTELGYFTPVVSGSIDSLPLAFTLTSQDALAQPDARSVRVPSVPVQAKRVVRVPSTLAHPDGQAVQIPAASDIPVMSSIWKATPKFEIPAVFPWVTAGLIIINLVIYIYGESFQMLLRSCGALNHGLVLESGQYYRMFTAIFLHASYLHVALNMILLSHMGRITERAVGPLRMFLIYVLGGLAGSLASILLNDHYLFSIGASGAVFAVCAATMFYFYRYRRWLWNSTNTRFKYTFAAALVLLLIGVDDPTIDNWAHLGGVVGGVLVMSLIGPAFEDDRDIPPETFAEVRRDMRPVMVRVMTVVTVIIGVILLLNALVPAKDRVVQVGPAEMALSGGWHILEPDDYLSFLEIDCTQPGMQCLLGANLWDLQFFVVSQGCFLSCGSIDDVRSSLMLVYREEGVHVEKYLSIQVSGRDAVRLYLHEHGTDETGIQFLVLERPNRVLIFTFVGPESSMEQMDSRIEDMIDSITFVES